jgi:hypothetical protein
LDKEARQKPPRLQAQHQCRRKYKLIRKRHVSTVREHDTNHFEGVLDPANTSRDVWADKVIDAA